MAALVAIVVASFFEAAVALQSVAARSSPKLPPVARRTDGRLEGFRLDADEVEERGSYCLDGSPPAMYFEPADAREDPSAATKWVIAFHGGGWCKTEDECALRLDGPGSSVPQIPSTLAFFGNPDAEMKGPFSAYNHVVLGYCDGGIFGGNREAPMSWPSPHDKTKNVTMYFRGQRILEHMIDTLKTPAFGLTSATEVLLAGGSTGGLATFMNADFVAARMPPSVKKFRAAPASGWFPYAPGLLRHGESQYLEEMRHVYDMHGMKGAGPSKCLAALPKKKQWQCIFADYSYVYSRTPFFVLQSLDSFLAIMNESTAELSVQKAECVASMTKDLDVRKSDYCGKEATALLNGVLDNFVQYLQDTDKFHRGGEGGFLTSCNYHQFYEGSEFYKYTSGDVTMAAALSKWWASDEGSPASWYLPCRLNTSGPPYQCESSCGYGA